MSASPDLDTIHQELLALRASQTSASVATVAADGSPEASHAPFLFHGGCFYLLLSGLAAHTGNLKHRPKAGLLILEPESQVRQIFARRRLSYACSVATVARETSEWPEVLAAMTARFGGVVEMLESLPDFVLFRLQPQQGQYVRGFGQAYRLLGSALDQPQPIEPG